MRVGVLTSSRADYGIYLPLLKTITSDETFKLDLIVFGTHLSKFHGYTIDEIRKDGFKPRFLIETLVNGDSPNAIATSYGLTVLKFSDFWAIHKDYFDIIFALGDRFEMSAAVVATVPFQIPIAHLHGGETTLGAIDNIYRHSITLASKLHFVSNSFFANRIFNLLNSREEKVYNVGSLSLENLLAIPLLTIDEFNKKWNIDLTIDSILVTVHPETIAFELNERYSEQIGVALAKLSQEYQIIITMPNADTCGTKYRSVFKHLASESHNIKLIENFGTQSYFTCMNYARLLLGNTSSGIVEAATFKKFILNLGDRQKGRLTSGNVIQLPFLADSIIDAVKMHIGKVYEGENIYYQPNSSRKIIEALKEYNASL